MASKQITVGIGVPMIVTGFLIAIFGAPLAGSFNILCPKTAANIGIVATQNKTIGAGAIEIPIQNKIVVIK